MADDKSRITILVDKELAEELQAAIPWGMRQHVVNGILRMVVDAIKKDGSMALGALISDRYRLILDYQLEKNDAETR